MGTPDNQPRWPCQTANADCQSRWPIQIANPDVNPDGQSRGLTQMANPDCQSRWALQMTNPDGHVGQPMQMATWFCQSRQPVQTASLDLIKFPSRVRGSLKLSWRPPVGADRSVSSRRYGRTEGEIRGIKDKFENIEKGQKP